MSIRADKVHAKVCLHDTLGVVPQDSAPFMVWRDAVSLDWDEETKEGLLEYDDVHENGFVNSASWILPQPGGQHLRPAGNGRVLLLWEHLHRHIRVPEAPTMPVTTLLDMYPELCLRGQLGIKRFFWSCFGEQKLRERRILLVNTVNYKV